MVGLRRIVIGFLFFSAFLVIPAAEGICLELFCRTGYKQCCVNGVEKCVEDTGQFCIVNCGGVILPPIVDNCTVGNVEYKPSGTCGTISRTCCIGKTWSGWGESCPKPCDVVVKPATTQFCTASNGKKGTQTRSVTCDGDTGEWVTGSWGTCVAPDCTVGETRTCPSNSKQVQVCTSSGKWSTSCQCANEGNGTVYCQGMRLTTSQANSCMHGIWSTETCSGICCCPEDTPKLMNNGYPGCWGTSTSGKFPTTGWQYACSCQRPGYSDGMLPML